MKIGFSLSPGGLLLPYHLGALASLSHHGYIKETTPLAGSSAGAIAVASHATGVPPLQALDASIRVSSKCDPLFLANGNLLPALQSELNTLLGHDAHDIINSREGVVGLLHRELFPQNKPVLQTQFDTKNCLVDAVCDSCMFPYFLTNRPFRTVKRREKVLPRVVVDGVFSVPLHRFGCPDFKDAKIDQDRKVSSSPIIDRTVTISVLPHDIVPSFENSKEINRISPELDPLWSVQLTKLARLAVSSASPKHLTKLYENGWSDSERWVIGEERRQQRNMRKKRRKKRENNNAMAATW